MTCPPTPASLQRPAHEYQSLMQSGQLSSEDLTASFLDQIDRHNTGGLGLRAVVSVCPREVALAQARRLDGERAQGEVRSGLHGIPIIIKDAIVTAPSLGMGTSAGSSAIATLKAKRNATIVERLLDAGIIILGKGNLTELCGLKADDTPVGWSAHGGQTLSPYRRHDLKDEDQPWPGGSSVGPAVGVAAGFAALGVGTETGGSNVLPASCNGLYGLTLPHGAVPVDGIQGLSETFDRVGLMARDPRDLKALAGVLLPGSDTAARPWADKYGPGESGWERFAVGILDSEWGTDQSSQWKWGSNEVKQKYASVAGRMTTLGAEVVYPLENPPQADIFQYEGDATPVHTIAYHEFPSVVEKFIGFNFEHNSSLTNVADLIAWNEAHADIAMPKPYTKQTELVKCLDDTMTPEKHDAAVAAIRHLAVEEGMARFMREQDLDIVLSASDARLISFSTCAGWPVATVPVGNMAKNDQPWGFFALARDGRMDLLWRFAEAFHATFDEIRGQRGPFERLTHREDGSVVS